jgi:predicted RNase H-like nuclease (RuvC/YqgF family)
MQHASEIRRYKYEIQDLKKTLKINKEIMSSVMQEVMTKDKQVQDLTKQCQENKNIIKQFSSEIEQFEDKCLILNQIKSFYEQAANDAENF